MNLVGNHELDTSLGRPIVVEVLLPAALPSTATDNGVVQSLHPNATSHEVPPGSDLPAEAPLRQQNSAQPTPPGQQQSGAITDGSVSVQLASTIPTVAFIAGQNLALPVVDGLSMDQNRGNVPPQLTSAFDVSATTGALPSPASSITDRVLNELTTAPPLVVVNRFGEDAATVRPPPVQTVPTTTTQRTTTTVRQTSPVTRQSTTRNTQRTTTRFITRVPPTPPPTPPRTTPTTTTTTTTTTILPPRPPPPPPSRPLPPPAQQQPLLPQAPQQPPQQAYPTIFYERPQAPPPRATAPPPPPPPIYVPEPAPTPYGTTPDSIIDHFFVPPSSQAANSPLPPSPIVGLWNQLGTKIADTADAIAGMLQKTVDVLVTSHIQSHQRALRRT
ncbi:hypothetical protein ZHAS_00006954 [Anopheles sinensis]|uniref:Uncharacterized protein n=1 Tax=Anopheles sinensis TaxID=74873 RepID=A0A084VNB7_ANOSI|nr:hypothetical protein ZHAS_00006954 [Anopheles sinensis]